MLILRLLWQAYLVAYLVAYLAAAFILSAVNRKSALASGLWHSKQAARLAFSLTFFSGVKT